MKDEGGRMKEKQSAIGAWIASEWSFNNFIPHPSSLILSRSARLATFILHPSSFILQQSRGLR